MNKQPMITAQKLRRILGATSMTIILALAAFGVLIAQSATKKRSFDGRLAVEVQRKLPNGQFEILDTAQGFQQFDASLLEAASSLPEATSGKKFTSSHEWKSRSSKGNDFSVRLTSAGQVNANLQTGQFDLKALPFEVTVNGKKEKVVLDLTTELVRAPDGTPINGKRARIVGNSGNITLVGCSQIKSSILNEFLAKVAEQKAQEAIAATSQRRPNGAADQRKGVEAAASQKRPSGVVDERKIAESASQQKPSSAAVERKSPTPSAPADLVVIIRAEGKISAK